MFRVNTLARYSQTSIARTPMACLPWLIRTHFESLRNTSASSRKQIFREIFLFYHEIVEAILMSTLNIQLL